MTTDLQMARHTVASVNPATGEVLRTFDCASDLDMAAAVGRARAAQKVWNSLGIRRRVETIRKFQSLLHENKSDVARLITQETGKPYAEALTTEVMVVLDAARFVIENAFAVLRDRTLPHGSLVAKTKAGRVLSEPYGVIGIISPWNYPFSIPATEALSALVAGNAVVLKPSEYTSLCALEFQSLVDRAGLLKDVLQVVVGDGTTGAALSNSEIDKVVFTGSVQTGKRVAQAAAARLLPVLLELGGKDPMLVLADANLDVASSGAIWGAFVNAGQTCLSVERCYVDQKIYDQFVRSCGEKARRLRVGNGLDPESDVGPLIHDRQLRLVESHVEEAKAHGARVVEGGKRLPELGPNFYAPTVLADVTQSMRIMREETFGPVLPVMSFATEEEAIRLANDCEYGLAASVWTSDRRRGERIASQISAGTVMVNDVVSCFGISEAPHGGVKASGIGRTHGILGLQEMVRVKYVDSDRLPFMKKVWWYRYGAEFAGYMERFLDLMFARRRLQRLVAAVGSGGVLRRKGQL
jgi:succinate-semialdehyde dehydrogenase/glutarate-semialdehyde dehydrogenase